MGNTVSLSLSSSAHKIMYKNVLGQQGSFFCMGYSPRYNVRTQEMYHMDKQILFCEDGTLSTQSTQRLTSFAGKKGTFRNNLEAELRLLSA